MLLNKRFYLLLLLSLVFAMPMYGQRFTKKEQALREARAKNYFYGHSFTLSAGYNHSWLTKDSFDNTDKKFGQTGAYQNTHDAFDFIFSWDICKKKYYGYQFSLGYLQNGGQKVYYQDNGLGYGPQLREDLTEDIRTQIIEGQAVVRGFLPLTYKSRLSLNVGFYLDRMVGSNDVCRSWDLGALIGVGYDWKSLSTSIIYKPGVYPNLISDSNTRQAALMFNVGVRLWK